MKSIPALVIRQWLPDWDKVEFSPKSHKRKPEPNFYLFTLPASWLKALSGINRRSAQGGVLRSKDLGIQRRHDEKRSSEIREFIRYGYPWSELSDRKRRSGNFDDLRKPGWLPTAIVVNIHKPKDTRRGLEVAKDDLLSITSRDGLNATVELPSKFKASGWKPSELHPIEVIDGQHRLWAFEDGSTEEDFYLPVVAFHGLDISWQAYLFWTINIKPKRINASLAFDLYPLLRTEDWLEKFEGHSIYRETRAQELTEALWAFPASPWYQRINMLGESGLSFPMVSQAAWIRALTSTYVKRSRGLFGALIDGNDEPLPWSRAQQAAFLILLGQLFRDAVANCKKPWTVELRRVSKKADNGDPAFYGPHTLLSTDQGIRGLLSVTNEICFARAKDLKLWEWQMDGNAAASDEKSVDRALSTLKKEEGIADFLSEIVFSLAEFDWRSSSAPGLSQEQITRKSALRGGSGYRELRQDLLQNLADAGKRLGRTAREILAAQN
jgi:DGQHR domain-containing protein